MKTADQWFRQAVDASIQQGASDQTAMHYASHWLARKCAELEKELEGKTTMQEQPAPSEPKEPTTETQPHDILIFEEICNDISRLRFIPLWQTPVSIVPTYKSDTYLQDVPCFLIKVGTPDNPTTYVSRNLMRASSVNLRK